MSKGSSNFFNPIALLFGVCGFLLLFFTICAWNGFVLSILWEWFIHDTFGIIKLSIPQAIGLSVIVRMLTTAMSTNREDDNDDVNLLLMYFLNPLCALFLGWIITLFM